MHKVCVSVGFLHMGLCLSQLFIIVVSGPTNLDVLEHGEKKCGWIN